jgi:flavin reductase (DIM6/NTAB) family NADH-FMN oxidoreductase RutF
LTEPDARAAFEALVGDLDYPMFIATVGAGDERAGCLVGFATQCSIDPPRFLVCISDKNRTYRVAREAEAMAVHFVPRDADDLAELFGAETGDDVDKFARSGWRPGPGGAPILDDCPNWFAGRILDRFEAGDHVGFLLEPIAAQKGDRRPNVRFEQVKQVDPGHEP